MPSLLQNPRSLVVLLVLLALTAGGIVLLKRNPAGETRSGHAEREGRAADRKAENEAPPAKPEPAPTTPSPTPSGSAFRDHLAALKGSASAEDARQHLRALRSDLLALPPAQATALVEEYITSGSDANLPLEFKVGTNGFLESPPTLRVGLLDLLGEIDPEAAARLGREILASPTTADEWAVSLRNVARGEKSEHEFLRSKTEELIRHADWQARPSVGYLNAFDVLVHTRATESTPLLSELIQRKERRDLAHAGFLTLDRLTQRTPVVMLQRLQEDRALQESRPEMVAQQFARADLRDDSQRALVRTWLLDPARTPAELGAFAGIFPNNNQMISRNLLTKQESVSGSDLLAHDREALAVVIQWQEDPAFEEVRPHLGTMAQRLTTFIRQEAP